jgi:hypothetical protein
MQNCIVSLLEGIRRGKAQGRREGARDRGEMVVAGPREGDEQLHGGGGGGPSSSRRRR